ncbi:MAG: CvpA family protein [Erysipelotrichia bacterium]|jgi:uncharacterized membrane protein required for colicin V production|nr:CvpA family protein [Erysipelotrichia bacterium]
MIETLLQYPWIINILIALFVLIRLRMGLTKGLLLMLFELLSLGIALLFASMLLPVVSSQWMIVNISDANINTEILEAISGLANQIVWFFILFAIGSLLMLLVTPLIKVISKVPIFKPINSFFGAMFSLIGTWIWLFIFSLILMLPWIPSGSTLVNQSWFAPIQTHTLTLFDEETRNDTVQASKILFTILTDPDQVSDDERAYVKQWLLKLGLDEAIINQFLEGN